MGGSLWVFSLLVSFQGKHDKFNIFILKTNADGKILIIQNFVT